MADKHTPGPWRLGKGGGTVVCDTPLTDRDTGHGAVEYYGGHLIAESILRSADARLIAAAPELLELCERALVQIDDRIFRQATHAASDPKAILVDALRATIKKVGGEL